MSGLTVADGNTGKARACLEIQGQTLSSMRRLIATLGFAGWLVAGCRSTVVDAETRFRFEGEISDESGIGLPGVRVYFVDTGLDEWMRKSPKERLVGESDQSGRLSASFAYPWGYTRRDGEPSIPGTFRLVLRKEELRPIRLDFRLFDLPRRGPDYLVQIKATLSRTPPGQ